MKLLRAPYSVLKVESKQSERQSKMARKHEGNHPIKSLQSKVRERERNFIAANNNAKMSQRDEVNKTSQFAISERIENSNNSYLPANYQTKCFKNYNRCKSPGRSQNFKVTGILARKIHLL